MLHSDTETQFHTMPGLCGLVIDLDQVSTVCRKGGPGAPQRLGLDVGQGKRGRCFRPAMRGRSLRGVTPFHHVPRRSFLSSNLPLHGLCLDLDRGQVCVCRLGCAALGRSCERRVGNLADRGLRAAGHRTLVLARAGRILTPHNQRKPDLRRG